MDYPATIPLYVINGTSSGENNHRQSGDDLLAVSLVFNAHVMSCHVTSFHKRTESQMLIVHQHPTDQGRWANLSK